MSSEWNNGYDNGQDGPQNENDGSNENYGRESNNEYAFQSIMRNGKPKNIGFSVASLVVGIISVVCCCFGWTFIMGILAIVFAVISRKNLGYFDGLSIAGLILGIFGVVFGVAIVIANYCLVTDPNMDSFLEEFWKEYYEGMGDVSDF